MMILLTENNDIRPGGHPSLKTVRRARARRRWNFRRYDVGRQRIDEACSDKFRAAIFCAAGDVVETISTYLYLGFGSSDHVRQPSCSGRRRHSGLTCTRFLQMYAMLLGSFSAEDISSCSTINNLSDAIWKHECCTTCGGNVFRTLGSSKPTQRPKGG